MMLRQTEIIVVAEFCNHLETGPVKCHDIEKNVVTFSLVHLLNLCRNTMKICVAT